MGGGPVLARTCTDAHAQSSWGLDAVLNTHCPLLSRRIFLVPKSTLTPKSPRQPLLMSTQPAFPHPPTFKLFLSCISSEIPAEADSQVLPFNTS